MKDQPTVTVKSGAVLLEWKPMGTFKGITLQWTAQEVAQLTTDRRIVRYSKRDPENFRTSLIQYAVRKGLIPQPAVYY